MDSEMRPYQLNWKMATAVILLYSLLTHGFLFLYSGVYSDGWLFYTYLSEGRLDLLYDFFLKQGHPQTALLYWPLSWTSHFLPLHRLLAFASLAAVGLLTYAIGRELDILAPFESLLAALFVVGFPAYQYAMEISHLWNLLPYPIFLAGWLLTLRAAHPERPRQGYARPLALLCFVIGFTNPALLVFHFGLLPLWLYQLSRTRGWAFWRPALRYPDVWLTPFLYWLLNGLLLPPHGIFADYNRPSLGNAFDPAIWREFVASGVLGQWERLLTQLPVTTVILLTLIFLAANRRWRWNERPLLGGWPSVAVLWGYSLWLFFLAVAPFAAVAKMPALYGFDTRVALLFGWHIALLLLGGIRLLFVTADGRLPRAGALAILLLLLTFSLAQMESYLAWQARWVRDQSVLLNLPDLEGAADVTLFYVDDRYDLYRRDNSLDPVSAAISRRYFQDWTIVLRQAYGSPPGRIGLDAYHLEPAAAYYQWVLSLRQQTLAPDEDVFFLANYDPDGAEGVLIIEPTETAVGMSKLGLTRRYWQYRLFQPAEREPFLRSLTALRLER